MKEELFAREIDLLKRSRKLAANGQIDEGTMGDLLDGYEKLLKESRRLVRFSDRSDRKLKEAQQAADAANKAKSEFVATMSHEIRTPMNGVVGMIDILKETPLDEEQKRMLGTVRDSAFSLLQIIDDVLDFSKIEAGKLDIENIPVSLCDVLEGVAATLQPNAARKSVRLSVFVDPALPVGVLSDPVRLRQIIFNLGGNAIKFTETSAEKVGTVQIRLDQHARHKQSAIVRLSVIDNGIGMSRDSQSRLFEAFTQAESSTTRRFGGTGLGLSICKKLTAMMGGDISVDSVEGAGSTFLVELPLDVDDDHSAVDASVLAGIRCVAALGDPAAQEIVERYLAAADAQLDTGENFGTLRDNGMKAITAGRPYDVFILGSLFGAEAQDEMIEALRRDAADANPRFVVLTTDRARKKGMVQPDMVVIEEYPLRRDVFLHGVAMAAGRASPQTDTDVTDSERPARKAPTVEEALAAGQLILIAEDNVTNQDVIRRQLGLLGYACEIAGDGREALEMWRARDYAALLTDCHMPQMDGYELTGHIRAAEQSGAANKPVIAITANALQGERERCLQAGMDDCLTKPLEMQKLAAALSQWLPETGTAAAPAPEPAADAAATSDEASPIDPRALMDVFGDDPETFREILLEFIEPSNDIVDEIEQAFAAQDSNAVGAAAHKLKSSSRSVGAFALADACERLEKAGKGGNWPTINDLVPQIRALMEPVQRHIESL